VLEGIVYLVVSTFPPGAGSLRVDVPAADWRGALFLVVVALASTLFFALAPALQATRVDLVRAIRGELVPDARPGRSRNVLVVMQVTGSVLLLTCAAIFLQSSWATASVEPGIRVDGILTITVLDEQRRQAILDTARTDPSVAAMAASWPGLIGGRPATAEGADGKSAVMYQFVSPDYFGVLDVDVVRGRGFTPDEQSADAAVALVSETMAHQLWPGGDAIGQVLRLASDPALDPRGPEDPPSIARSFNVVGVARDVAGFRMGGVRMGGAGVGTLQRPLVPRRAAHEGNRRADGARRNALRRRQAGPVTAIRQD
jgi:hypothetical protein